MQLLVLYKLGFRQNVFAFGKISNEKPLLVDIKQLDNPAVVQE